MNEWDEHEAKKHGRERAERMYDDHYQGYDQYNPNERERPNFNY